MVFTVHAESLNKLGLRVGGLTLGENGRRYFNDWQYPNEKSKFEETNLMGTAVKEINKYIKQLTPEEQQQLASELKKQLLIAEAERLSGFSPRRKIAVTDIVKEIRISRKKRYASKHRA